jgi:hypothetical protein
MAHSTRSRLGSAWGLYCPILFIVTVYKGLHFRKTNAGRVQKCLLRAFFEASQWHLRIPAHPALRIAGARRSQIEDRKTKDLQFGSSPIVPGHTDPVCSKVHTLVAKLHFHNL